MDKLFTVATATNAVVTALNKGDVVGKLYVRSEMVYCELMNGLFTVIGRLTKENYSWSETESVKDMDNVELVVLDYYETGDLEERVEFSRKHLLPYEEEVMYWVANEVGVATYLLEAYVKWHKEH